MASTTYHHATATTTVPTFAGISKSVQEQLITESKSDSDNAIMGTSTKNNEDYDDGEESEEVYDDTLHLNYSGKFFDARKRNTLFAPRSNTFYFFL
jgi:hypothetical protein